MTIYEIVMLIVTIVFGGLSLYFKTKTDLMNHARDAITEAENTYRDATEAGGEKFNWVVDTLYKWLPTPLKFVFTKDMIGVIVQRTFDGMAQYTTTQIDKLIDRSDK